jgi:O-methyltransferase involved in polyketide biosynthesis
MALFRGVEQGKPQSTRLFEDPIASSLVSGMLRAAVQLGRHPVGASTCGFKSWIPVGLVRAVPPY